MSALRTALRITNAVLGAGTLLVPAALAPLAKSGIASVAVAGVLLAWSLLIGVAGGTGGSGAAGFVRERLGPRMANVVHALYFAGFAVGQAVVVGAAGQFAAAGPTAVALGFGILLAAAALAVAGVTLPLAVRKARTLVTLALALMWWLFPGVLSLDTGRVFFRGTALIAVSLMFAWVGLEGSVPSLRSSPVSTTLGVVTGLACPALLYGVLLASRGSQVSGSHEGQVVIGWTAAVVLGAYCLTNLHAVAARWNTLLAGTAEKGTRGGSG